MTADDIQSTPETSEQQNRELLEKIFKSVERTRKMFLWTLIISVVAIVFPLVGLAFAIPYVINTYMSVLSTQFGL